MENAIKMGWFGGTTIFGNTKLGVHLFIAQVSRPVDVEVNW